MTFNFSCRVNMKNQMSSKTLQNDSKSTQTEAINEHRKWYTFLTSQCMPKTTIYLYVTRCWNHGEDLPRSQEYSIWMCITVPGITAFPGRCMPCYMCTSTPFTSAVLSQRLWGTSWIADRYNMEAFTVRKEKSMARVTKVQSVLDCQWIQWL